MQLKKKIIFQIILIGLLLIVAILGFLYPSLSSRSHINTERGSLERSYLDLLMEDWRIVRPCAPIGYVTTEASGPSCPSGEDQVVVKTVCWFGIPGPRFQMCYRDSNSAELGTGRPILLQ